MDAAAEIKARLPIEELVGQYVQLKKKGRTLVGLCPFHSDSHPSMQVSPDKGIAYCFACQTGGDIFSFYQAIEGVNFKQALKDLGEKTGVKVETKAPKVDKDKKTRLRECLVCTHTFYAKKLESHTKAKEYLLGRGVENAMSEKFGLGVAPDSFSDTYQHLLKEGFTKQEIIDASLAILKDLGEGKMYDRFRNRLMFPIHDHQGELVGFGGRTLGEDDAKYINSGETPLYNKSTVLYGLHLAKEAIRKSKRAILVEGYFDVIACHRAGVENVVAVSGTALTEQHVKMLKRYADEIVLCLDQDRAGADAAERAFLLCSAEKLPVKCVQLPHKDPDEAVNADPEGFATLLSEGGVPYLDAVIESLRSGDVRSADGKHSALLRLLPLLDALSSSVEREHYIASIAGLLGTTDMALKEDITAFNREPRFEAKETEAPQREATTDKLFSSTEIALGMFLLFPGLLQHIDEMIPPAEGFEAVLHASLKELPENTEIITADILALPPEYEERAGLLQLYCEHHGFGDWSESLALREIRNNCRHSNRDILNAKKRVIAEQIRDASAQGNTAEVAQLTMQLQEVVKLGQMAST